MLEFEKVMSLLQKTNTPNVMEEFVKLDYYMKELKIIKYELVEPYFNGVQKEIFSNIIKKDPNLGGNHYGDIYKARINLYIKTFLFVLRQAIDSYLNILHNLSTIMLKNKEGLSYRFSPFLKAYDDDKFKFEEELELFFQKYMNEIVNARFFRNTIKDDNRHLSYSFSIQKKQISFLGSYIILKPKKDDALLRRFEKLHSKIDFNVYTMLDTYIKLVEDFYKVIVEVLERKIK